MGYMSWTIDYNDPISMLEIMKSDAGSIPTFWVNEEYDKLITQAYQEMMKRNGPSFTNRRSRFFSKNVRSAR